MTASNFDKAFGTDATFAKRIGRGDAAGETHVGSGPYKAYGFLQTGTINETCEIVRWMDGTEIPEGIDFQYRFLMQMGFVGEEQLKLFLPDCIVVIEGRNLRDLRKKLARRQVTFVQQYSSKVWPKAPLNGEPLIEKIQVVRPNT